MNQGLIASVSTTIASRAASVQNVGSAASPRTTSQPAGT
jgi:hypothetical protein